VKLNNPPVIQTWIGFAFAPGPQKRTWDLQTADDFLSRFESSLPLREAIFERQYAITEISPSHQPQVVSRKTKLDKARARNKASTHWLQLADDQIVYNRTRGDEPYLGYESLRDEAVGKLSEYVDFFRPVSLLHAELHYVDLIELPAPPERKLVLDDYFRLRVEIPEVFGPTWHFSGRVFLSPPVDGDILEVKFQSELPSPDTAMYRFRIEWHMVCAGIASFEPEVVKGRLDQAHRCLLDNFRASVTDRTWESFQPSDEG
jgi:uncharacterized protein (TIGR04255 family)